MAEYLHFSRDSRLYMEKDGHVWSIPVLDGFSFSQATNASEVTLNEMEDSSGRSRRGRKMFTDSLSAAEWSFSTYARPFLSTASVNEAGTGSANRNSTAQVHAVEEALWVAMAGQNVYNRPASKFTHPTTGGTISSHTVADATDSDSGDRTDGTYTFNVGSGQNTTNITYTGAGVNAVLSVVVATVDGVDGVSTCTFTEGGQKFFSGETITVDGLGLGGDADSEDMVITVYAESMIQYTAAATSATLSPDGTPAKAVTTAGATPAYAAASAASDRAIINFTDSNRAALGTFNLYFLLSDRTEGRLVYKLENAVVNEASFDFDIDGIATISWSGMAGQIKDVSPGEVTGAKADVWTAQDAPPTISADKQFWLDTNDSDKLYIANHEASGSATNVIDAVGDNAANVMGWRPGITEGTTDTGNFIRNRLTQLTLAPEEAFRTSTTFTNAAGVAGQSYETSYQVALTGGNVTISNNISYLTPEEIGKVNQPIEHVTGTRTVSGSLTCYLGSSDIATNKVADLFKDLVADTNTVINKFNITLAVGGSATGPKIELSLPTAHLEIPSHSIEDVISVETNFSGLGSAIGEGDELKITYKAA